ncbi:glycosyl hydrolase [Aegicerativicinus sediminis]|uniref:glycosyl hydrolase n=1 Tax=Aegicerativicinus sediminis TaxID=2893202 RepID=UPI001E5123FF|nr:glycosyl hydrolase [Aegicerativicinus sediminis]
MKLKIKLIFLITIILGVTQAEAQNTEGWPDIESTTKPWTRWWWMGNAVDKKNIKRSLTEFKNVGLGGVEITPIYGVKGEEKNNLIFLSKEWIELLDYTIKIADSLELGVDMTLGTGWPYGGPQVTEEYAATKLIIDKTLLPKGEKLKLKIQPDNPKEQKSSKLKYLLAFGVDGAVLDLTSQIKGGELVWEKKKSDFTLYEVYIGKTNQKVKRAAPGGAGLTLDHYSQQALDSYVKPFDEAFESLNHKLRAIFNDSYEVYGTDFTPQFFEEFEARRGYDLKGKLDLLLDSVPSNEGNRVRSDYRETLSDLLLNDFDKPWDKWANNHGFKTKLQAHGSPGNLIDLYASADIPECETFGSMPYDIPNFRREKEDVREGDADPIMLKFSSSAAHISGKPLVSSETFTWLRDHFKTALSQCKPEVEDLLLNGVNHVFLHGSTYSPERAVWPGWKFYASVNFNSTNPIWEDADALFGYIARCQSMLQLGKPDNDLLVYWPIYDVWDSYLKGDLFFQFKIHSLNEWLLDTEFYKISKALMSAGYGVDFTSDDFVSKASVENGLIVLPGGKYKGLVIPDCNKMPIRTFNKLLELKKSGANIIFQGMPESVPGYFEYKEKESKLLKLIEDSKDLVLPSNNIIGDLEKASITPESIVDYGLKYIRRDVNGEKVYYLVNHTRTGVSAFIPLNLMAEEVVIYDPLTGNYGKAETRIGNGKTKVYVDIPSGTSLILKSSKVSNVSKWNNYAVSDKPFQLNQKWKLNFITGGPKIPSEIELDELKSWTELGGEAAEFSGSAEYKIEFQKPDIEADNWQLNLGDVRESAEVWLNGKFLGTAWSVPFAIQTGALNDTNLLVVKVSNLAANRIRAKEMRGEEWKIFEEINMVNKDYKPFDATLWAPMPSGLLGPVTITPLKKIQFN